MSGNRFCKGQRSFIEEDEYEADSLQISKQYHIVDTGVEMEVIGTLLGPRD